MWSAIVSIVSALTGSIGDSWKKYQERKIAEHEVKLARIEAEKQLAMKKAEAELKLGKVQVEATGRWFKYLTFTMWFFPFILSTFFPEHGAVIFKNWEVMPQWYSQSVLVIMFAVWGIQVSKPAVANIFAGLSSYFKDKRSKEFNSKLFYDALRSNKGTISQYEVEIFEKAIKAAQEQSSEK